MVLYAMCFSSLPFSHDDPHVVKAGQKDECQRPKLRTKNLICLLVVASINTGPHQVLRGRKAPSGSQRKGAERRGPAQTWQKSIPSSKLCSLFRKMPPGGCPSTLADASGPFAWPEPRGVQKPRSSDRIDVGVLPSLGISQPQHDRKFPPTRYTSGTLHD